MSDQTRHSTGWQLEQSASEAYERYLVPPLFTRWGERLVDAGEVQVEDRVLDVACGTGIVARRVAARTGGDSIVGLDINDGMLAVAEAAAADVQPPIEWRQGDATDLPFSEGSFDVVCCQQALQFFDDPAGAIEEMRRVLAPDGRVAVSVWRPLEYQPGYVVLADALDRLVGEEAGAMMRSPFPAWDDDHLRTLAREAGFEDVAITIEIGAMRYPSATEFVRREAASSPLAEPIASAQREVRDDLVQEIEERLEDYTDEEGITFPMESYVLTAHR